MFIDNNYERPFRSFAGMRWPQERPSAGEVMKAISNLVNQTPFSANLRCADGIVTLEAFLPGVPKSAIAINIVGPTITVEVSQDDGESGAYILREALPIQGVRAFRHGEDLDPASASAELKDGVLTLKVRKKQNQGARVDIA